jgi:mannitol/fructose-specific phosphotransferase system IIA component (Ntr-type)
MRVTDLITEDHVLFLPAGLDRCGVIRYIVMAAPSFQTQEWDSSRRNSLIRTILKREDMGSTANGRGVAYPHVKLDGVKDALVYFAYSVEGVDFNSLDGEPVYFFWLLVSPVDKPGLHLGLLLATYHLLFGYEVGYQEGTTRKAEIRSAGTAREICRLFRTWEGEDKLRVIEEYRIRRRTICRLERLYIRKWTYLSLRFIKKIWLQSVRGSHQ